MNDDNSNNNDNAVIEALSKAKWNETVEVSIHSNDDGDDDTGPAGRSDRSVVLLAASLDTTNGGVQWNDVSSGSGGDVVGQSGNDGESEAASVETTSESSIIISRHLQTKKWIFPMLNDHVRNRRYEMAIEQASEDVVRRFIVAKNDDCDSDKADDRNDNKQAEATSNKVLRCLDIGSGTGLLAMLSARSLQTCWQRQEQRQTLQENPNDKDTTTRGVVQVTSLEMSRPMAKLAQKIVQRNGFRRCMDHRSDDASDSDRCRIPSIPSSSRDKIEVFVDVIEGHSCEIDKNESISPETSTDPSISIATKPTSTCNHHHIGEDYTKAKQYHLCTSELLESGLLGEGWLPAIRDAWERHLHPNAIVVPQRGSVYAQVITDNGDDKQNENGNDSINNSDSNSRVLLEDYTGPYKVLGGFPNDRSMRLFTNSPGSDYEETLDGMVSGTGRQLCFGVDVPFFQQDMDKDGTKQIQEQFKYLSDPIKVLDIDVTSLKTIPSPTEIHSTTKRFTCTESGKAKGVLFWWELSLYNDISYSTKPGELPFQDHWHACLFLFPPKDSVVSLEKGQTACIITNHDDTSISFGVSRQDSCRDDVERRTDSKRLRLSTELQTNKMGSFSLVSPQRCLQLNCIDRLTILRNSIDAALNKIGKENACVLDVSDFSLCGIMAALLGAGKVTSLESSTGPYALATASAYVAQLGNNLLPSSSDEKLRIIQCHNEHVTSKVLVGERPANIVVAEPFYTLLEGWTKQEALNLFYTLRGLKNRGAVDEDAICVPSCAKIMAQAFEFYNLGDSYKPCESDLCGFNHDLLSEYWSLDRKCISHSIWNTSSFSTRKPLTDASVIAILDYQNNKIVRREPSTSIKYNTVGTAHIVVSWIDYEFPDFQKDVTDARNKDDNHHKMPTVTLSTNTRLYNQSVFVLPEPVVVTEEDIKNGLTIDMGYVFADHV